MKFRSLTIYRKFRPWQAILTAFATMAGFAAIELALVFGIRVCDGKWLDELGSS